MVCTTVTIVQAKPIVSNLVATPRAAQQGWVDLSWSQDIAGNITISVDSVTVNQGGYAAGTNTMAAITQERWNEAQIAERKAHIHTFEDGRAWYGKVYQRYFE